MKYLIKPICLFLFLTSFFHVSAQYSPLNVIIKESNGNVAAHATDGVKLTNSTLPYNYLWKLDGKLIDSKTDSIFLKCDLNTLLKGKEPKKTIKYGRLYNWYATQGTGDKSIAPEGWHVPTDFEWSLLTDYVGGLTKAGAKLKETGTAYWNGSNSESTNEVGFCARPGGQLSGNTFSSITDLGSWWSSTADNTSNGLNRKLTHSDNAEITESTDKRNGKSIRCIKDAKSKVFAYIAPKDFIPSAQPVNIIDVFNNYSNPDKRYIFTLRNTLNKLTLNQGQSVVHGYELDGTKHTDNYTVQTTNIVGPLAAGNYTVIPVVSTAGFPENGIIRIQDRSVYADNERYREFVYTSKTATSFIGNSQEMVQITGQSSGRVDPVVEMKGTNNWIIVNGAGLTTANVLDDACGINGQVGVAAGQAYEWLYCGSKINSINGSTCYLGYQSIKYIHLEDEMQLGGEIEYCAFYGGSQLQGELTIPRTVTIIGEISRNYNYGLQYLNCSNLTKVTIPSFVNFIGNAAFAGCSSVARYDIYTLAAPSVPLPAFGNYAVPLHIRPDATGFDVSPWTDTSVFSEIIRDLKPVRDEDTVSLTDSTVTDIDGNVYKTLAIGSQIWMDKNLAVDKYRNGAPILQNFSGSAGAVSAYDNDKNNVFNISKTYDLSVSTTDQNSATATDTLAITPADSLSVKITDSIAINTNGSKGTLVAHARGGERLIDSSLPYTFSWKLNGQVIEGKTDSILSDIPAGNYSVEITDNCGNVAKDAFTLQAKLEVKLNESNGVIAAKATGGVTLDSRLPYNYTWKLDGEVIAGQTDSTISRCDLNGLLKGRTLKVTTNKTIKYGRLYNWYAATDNRNIAPVGWHVPTSSDWIGLMTSLGQGGFNYDGSLSTDYSTNKLAKAVASKTDWVPYVNWQGNPIINLGSPVYAPSTNNTSGLNMFPAGFTYDGTNVVNIGKYCCLMHSDFNGFMVAINIGSNYLGMNDLSSKNYGLSVRLIKDNFTYEGDIIIDGDLYKTIKIGNQVWLQQNLAVTHYRNGDPILQDFSGTEGAYINDNENNVFGSVETITSKTFDLSVTISDQNAITAKEFLTLLPPDTLSVDLNNSIAITAYGGKGTLVAHAKGGVKKFNGSLPYNYSWKRNGVVLADKTDSILSDIPAGNYSVEITDNCEKNITDSFTLLDPLDVEINVSHPILSNAGTGTLAANGKGGVKFKTGLPYRYTWYQGDFDTELEGKTDSILSDVGAGMYSVEIMDSTGTSEGMPFTLTQPEKLRVKISESQPILTNDGVGTLVANATGGVKPYSYAWYKDNGILNGKADATLLDIPAGNYSVQITDSNKITVSSSFTFIKHDSLKVSIVESNSMPYKGGIGTLVALASGGVNQDNNSHYNYTWKLNGEAIEGETDSVISLCQLNSYLDGKPKETILKTIKYGYLYNGYVIYDNRKITSSDEWIVPNTNIGYSLVSYTGTQLKEQGNSHWINGGGENTVGFNLRPSGYRYGAYDGVFSGVGVLSDLWCTGALNQYNSQACIRYGGTNWFIGAEILAGGMAIRICREANRSELSLANGTAVDPYIGNDGVQYKTVKIDNYVWTSENLIETKFRNGDKIPVITNGVSWQLAIASALCSYDNDETNAFSAKTITNPFNLSITVTDKNTIAATDSFALTKPDLLEVNITASTSILGNGGKGTLVATAKGGAKLVDKSTLYNYVWSLNGKVLDGKTDSILSDAGAGEYNVEITDNCGNTATNSFTLMQPEKLDVKISESTPLLDGESASTLVAHSSGGVKFATGTPYKYQWFKEDVKLDDKTDSTLLDVPAGKYTVQITDANNITASFLFTLIQHDVLNVQISKSINNNGDSVLVAHGVGGVKQDNNLPYNYSYSWDINGEKIEGETDSIISLCNLYKYLNGKEPKTIIQKTIKYGRLYNWYVATDFRNIAPLGWHVSTDDDWQSLLTFIGSTLVSPSLYSNASKLMSVGFGSGTNETNLSIIGSGNQFGQIDQVGVLWTSTGGPHTYDAKCYRFNIWDTNLQLTSQQKLNQMAIRLIKDNSTNEGDVIIDGDTYHSVTIGSQVWLQQNLAVRHYQNGDLIGSDFSGTEGAVTAYNNDESNVYNTVETKGNKFDIGITITDKNAATATNSYALAKVDLLEVKITASNTILSYGGKATLTATAKGGIRLINSSLPYNYTWKLNGQVIDGKNDSVLSDMPAGNYSVEINDKCGIVATNTFELIQPDPFNVRILVADPILSNGNPGTLVAHATGGTRFVDNYMPYNYTWYRDGAEISSGDSILYNAYAGKYSVEISDANGIIVTDSFTLTQPDVLVLKMSELVPLLNSESTGTLAASVTGGIKFKTGLPYRYTWYQGADFETELVGQTDSTLSDVGAGIYSVEIMDSTGTQTSISAYKFIPHDTLKVKISESVPISSYGGVGTLVARGNGGVKYDSEYRYNYCWYRDGEETGVYDSIMTNAGAGNYSVMIYDANGNTATDSYVLTQPEELSVEINVSHPILGNGGTGTLVANGKGGIKFKTGLPYRYTWYQGDFDTELEGQTDSILSDVGAVMYSVEIMDSTETSVDMSFTLTEPEKLEVEISESQPLLTNDGVGTLVAICKGGVKPYSYAWYKDNGILNGKADATLSDIPAGNYSVQITDSNKITVSSSFTLIKHDSLKVSIVESNAMPYKGGIGTLVALAAGGVKQDNNSHYNYTWKLNGEVIEGETDSVISLCNVYNYLNDAQPNVITKKSIKYGRLYNWYAATDPRGIAPVGWHVPTDDEWNDLVLFLDPMAVYNSATTSESDFVGGLLIGSELNTVNFNALYGGVLANGYSEDIEYNAFFWTSTENFIDDNRNGRTAWDRHFFVGSDHIYKDHYRTLNLGMSVRLIKDNSTNEGDVIIDGDTYHSVTIGNQVWLQQNLAATHYRNGDLIGSDFSGTEGAVTAYNNDENNVYDIVDIPTNNYDIDVTVTDKNSATADNTYTLTKQEPLEVEITASASILGYGGKGTLVATAKGGVKLIGKSTLYNYVWSQNGKVLEGKTDSVLLDAGVGEYNVEISDNCGNSASSAFTLAQPEKLEVKVRELTPLLNSESTSTLVAHGSGGVRFETDAPYKYQWYKEDLKLDDKTDSILLDVPAGKYTVQITDANNITVSFLFTLIQHDVLKVQISKSINNNGDSILVAHGTGGVKQDNNLPYNYIWNISGEKIESETDSIISLCNLYQYLNGKEPATITQKSIKYGRLYNWYAATDVRGIAPDGWHVPSQSEWQTLIDFCGGRSVAGGELKESGTIHWDTESGATNNTGFTALPSGKKYPSGNYNEQYNYTYFWTTTLDSYPGNAGAFSMYSYGNTIDFLPSEMQIQGLPIRLIKDNSTYEGDVIIDGDTYHSVSIGTQVWLQQNLSTKHYRNGDPIGSNFTGTEGAVIAYDNDENNVYNTVETLSDKSDIVVTITDKNEVTTANSYALAKADSLKVKISVLNGIHVNGGKGTLVAHASGGVKSTPVKPYNYSWYLNGSVLAGKSDSILSDIGAGHYSVSITNNCGTVATDSFTLSQPDKLEANINEITAISYYGGTGSIVVHVNGGVKFPTGLPYSYTWYHEGIELADIKDSILPGVIAGNYSVRIADYNGNEVNRTFKFMEPDPLKVDRESEYAITLSLNGIINTSQLLDSERNWSNIIFSNQAGNEIEDNCYIEKCKVPDFFYYKNNEDKWTISSGGNFSYAYGTVDKFSKTDITYYDVNCHPNYIKIYTNPIPQKLAGPGYKVENTNLVNSINLIYPYCSDSKDNVYKSSVTNVAMSVSVKPRRFRLYKLDDNSEPVTIKESIPLHSSDNVTLKASSGFPLELYKWEYGISTEPNVIVWKDINPDLQNKETLNFSPSDLINDSDFINIEDNGGRLFIRIKSESFEGNQIAEIIPIDKAPHFKSVTAIEPSCTGLDNGKIKISFDRALYRGEELKVICDDGSGGDSYTVNSETDSITINGLLSGKYRLSLIGQMSGYQTNTDESRHLDSATVEAPLPVKYEVRKIENVKCYADSTGEVTFDLSGGTGTYLISYSLKDSTEGELNSHLTLNQIKNRNAITSSYTILNNNKISGLVAGKYKFTIHDENHCDGGIGELEFTITQPHDSLKMILDESIPATAYGYMDGKIRVKITGGTKSSTRAYKLVRPDGTLISSIDSLSNDSVTQLSTINSLYAGKYTIIAVDSLGCNTMLEAKVSQPDSLLVTTTKAQPKLACHGGKGEFVAHAKGGVKPYSYKWYVSAESGWKTLLIADSVLTDITAGKYKVIVTDANKIEAAAIDSIIQPSSIELTSTITDVGCRGNSDGSIKISLQGGAPPYTISMNNNADYYSTQETDTSYTFKKLSAGDYYILVVDKNGCDGGIGKTKFSITQPAASLAIISSDSVLTTGYGKDNVNAKIQISGGTKPYKLTCDGDSIPFIYEDYTLISQLKSGNHILEVADIHNCVISKSMFVTQPDSLLAEINESIGIRCNGSSGELIAKVKGGVAPYSYKWLANTTFGKDTLLATNATLNNINAGEYEVIVTDKNGNSVKATYTLLQPSLLTYGAKSTESVRCYGGSDGKASFNVAGGTGSYKITYLNSEIPTDSTIIYPFEYPYTLSDLKAGTYHYTITDINGCNGGASQKSFSIGEKSKIKIELTSFIAPKGSISNDGTIGVKITNGIQPYNLIWTDGIGNVLPSIETAENGVVISKLSQLSEGVYKLVATDVNYSSANPNDACGSADTLVIDLKQPKPLELEIENLNPELKCHGDNNGMLIARAKGGVTFTPPALAYKYEWYRKTTTGSDLVLSNDSILQKSSGGDYYLRITDLNGIYLESSLVTINEPTALDINFDITNVLCNKSATGRVVATPSGGIPPYTYLWNHTTDPGITTTLDDVVAGKYSLTITDKNGCSIVKNAIVEQPAEMTVKVESSMPTCYKYTDGQINIKPSGGVAPYSINWKDGSVTELKTGLGAGSYSFTVTDANGCTKSLTEVLTQPDSIRVMIDSKEVTLCVNQVAEYNIILPDDPQAVYQWYNSKGLIAETPAVILNDPDIYTAKITTSKGCKGEASTTIIRSNDLLNVDFVTASQVGKNKQVEIINITTPAPEKMKWLIPTTAAIKIVEQTNEKITLEFEENGDYSIGLKTFKGQCENTLYKTIKVVDDSELSDYQDGEEAYIKRFMVSSNPNDGNFKVWLEFSEKAEGNLYLINTEAAQLLDTRSFNDSSWYEFSYSNQFVPGVYILKLVTKKAQAYFKIIIH